MNIYCVKFTATHQGQANEFTLGIEEVANDDSAAADCAIKTLKKRYPKIDVVFQSVELVESVESRVKKLNQWARD